MLKKATFNLHIEVLRGIEEAVASGAAPSKNALVERAIARELKDVRRAARRTAWEDASRDPQFLRDIEDVQQAFDRADAESASQID